MNLSDLTYLADTIGNLSGIPVRVYEGQKEVYRTFPVPLVRDPIALHLDRILALPGHVGYYMAEDFSYYGFVSCTDSGIPAESAPVERRLVIGPSRHSPFTKQALHRLAFDLEIPPEDVDSFVSAMRAIVTMPFEASTWHTAAPAFAKAAVAPPVYPNRFSISGLRPSAIAPETALYIHSQLAACSGNSPVCLNPIGSIMNLRPIEPYPISQRSGNFLCVIIDIGNAGDRVHELCVQDLF